jgi:hypothetical protein
MNKQEQAMNEESQEDLIVPMEQLDSFEFDFEGDEDEDEGFFFEFEPGVE